MLDRKQRQLDSYVATFFFVWLLEKYWQAAVFVLFTTYLFHPNVFSFLQWLCLYFNLFSFILIFHLLQHSASIKLFSLSLCFIQHLFLLWSHLHFTFRLIKTASFPCSIWKYSLWSCNALRILLRLSKFSRNTQQMFTLKKQYRWHAAVLISNNCISNHLLISIIIILIAEHCEIPYWKSQ